MTSFQSIFYSTPTLQRHTTMSRNRSFRTSQTCNDCGEQSDIIVYPYTPAKTSGCIEDCEPPDGGYVEPEHCKCGSSFDYEEAMENE
jgi:hypothetical protein